MKYVISTVSAVLFSFSFYAFAEEPCDCPKLACDPCSVEKGITFFTDKCGPQNARLKSCARPTCIPVDEATKECPVPPKADSGPREPVVVKAASSVQQESAASVNENPSVGKVKVLAGSVSIVHADGKKSVVTSGEAELKEDETVESSKDGGAVVDFNGGNQMHVHGDTQVRVQEFKDQQAETSRKAIFHLIKGKIRNKVEQKYNGKTSYYRVLTKSAVAGVRGTDFVMEQAGLETKVQTIGGNVVLSGHDEKEARSIKKGEWAKFTGDEGGSLGSLSPVYKMSQEQLNELDKSSRVDLAKGPKAPEKEMPICARPKGAFNQCMWKCVGNPEGESHCKTDLPNVTCVRSRCNGNGAWAEETKLPHTSRSACPGSGHLVKDCDY